MTTKNKAEGWVIALVVMGVLFIAFGVYNWQAGLSLRELSPTEQELAIIPFEDWQQVLDNWPQLLQLQERLRDGQDHVNTGQTMVVAGSIITVIGVISLARGNKKK